MQYLIDTNILIDVSRSNPGAIAFLDNLEEPWLLSQITAMELIVGARDKRELIAIDAFLSSCQIVTLCDSIGELAYQLLKKYAKSHGLHVFDSLIAATALNNSLTLATLNRKHFQMIEGLRLDVPQYSSRESL